MPHFFVKLRAPRPDFSATLDEAEKQLMQEHFAYWKGRQNEGEVLVFGPVLDPAGTYGMGIIEAPDETAARAFAARDPAMRSGRGFSCEIHPMQAVTRETNI